MAEIAEEFPDEKWQPPEPEKPEDEFEPRIWHGLYFRAFDDLRFDRWYGAMGGVGPVYYQALSRYADDNGIHGNDRQTFFEFFKMVDAEWLEFQQDREKEREKRAKELDSLR